MVVLPVLLNSQTCVFAKTPPNPTPEDPYNVRINKQENTRTTMKGVECFQISLEVFTEDPDESFSQQR